MFISSSIIVCISSSNEALYNSAKTSVSVNFFVNSLKYPSNSVLSFHEGWTEATHESFFTNFPHAYAKDVFPVPEIPWRIINLPHAKPAKKGLKIEKDAVEEIVDLALSRKTGARGLRAILENIMMDAMYEVPSDKTIKRCIITKDVVINKAKPIYER